MPSRAKSAAAGAVAATVWGLAEPLDCRLLRSDHRDIAVLGKAFTRGPAWKPIGYAVHAVNGALFGLAYHEVRAQISTEPRRLALAMAMVEHLALWPAGYLVDRFHPALGQRGVPPLLRNGRAFAQQTWRHALFGFVLGRLAR